MSSSRLLISPVSGSVPWAIAARIAESISKSVIGHASLSNPVLKFLISFGKKPIQYIAVFLGQKSDEIIKFPGEKHFSLFQRDGNRNVHREKTVFLFHLTNLRWSAYTSYSVFLLVACWMPVHRQLFYALILDSSSALATSRANHFFLPLMSTGKMFSASAHFLAALSSLRPRTFFNSWRSRQMPQNWMISFSSPWLRTCRLGSGAGFPSMSGLQ
nr:MAG TPA: hypothetical protein [Caudoviricetes sp.]